MVDHGPGIPEHERRRVFQPFYRIGDELARVTPGSGLGLALVQVHVKAHGGRIDIESTPGSGATMRLFLPTDLDTLPATGWQRLLLRGRRVT